MSINIARDAIYDYDLIILPVTTTDITIRNKLMPQTILSIGD